MEGHKRLSRLFSGNLPAMFYNSNNLNSIGALSFFKIGSHIVMIFDVKLEYWFGLPKQEVEQKSEWFCGVKFFRSNFVEV